VEIGRRLGLGRGTVRRLLSSAMAKLGADTRSQAVALVEA
jgi:DNA-binding CsgD family transcriptional regulator